MAFDYRLSRQGRCKSKKGNGRVETWPGLSRPLFLIGRGFLLLRAARPLAYAMFRHFFDPRCNTCVAPHQCVQVVSVEPQQVGAGDRGDSGRTTCPPQKCDLAKKLTGTEP